MTSMVWPRAASSSVVNVSGRSMLSRTAHERRLRELRSTTYAAADALVSRLAEIVVLEESTDYARNGRLRYAPYIALLPKGVRERPPESVRLHSR